MLRGHRQQTLLQVYNACPQNLHTSTLEAKKTQVGAMSTGSILFREYLKTKRRLRIIHVGQVGLR